MTFIRYVTVQLVAYGIDIGLFLASYLLAHFNAVLSNVVAKIAAGAFALLLHRAFTFRIEEGNRGRQQTIRYFSLLALNIPISSAVLSAILLFIGWPTVAKVISDIICVVLSFLLSKRWVFAPPAGNLALRSDRKPT